MDINQILQGFVQSMVREITPLVLAEVQKTIGEQNNTPVIDKDEMIERIERIADSIADDIDTSDIADKVARRLYLTAADIADAIDTEELASEVANNISIRELAEQFDPADIAGKVDASDVADHVDLDAVADLLLQKLTGARLSVTVQPAVKLEAVA